MQKIVLCFTVAFSLLSMTYSQESFSAYSKKELQSKETERDQKLREILEKEVSQLQTTLKRRLPQNRRADLYLRMAESNIELYRLTFLLEGRVYQDRLQSGLKKNQKIDQDVSRSYLKKAIEACQDILNLKISYPQMEKVYYFLAYNYQELGNRSKAISYYQQIVQKYPKSAQVGEAYRSLAEYEYEKGNFKRAIPLFEKAIPSSKDTMLARVYHKLAWSYYRTRKFSDAIQSMKKAIESAKGSQEKFLAIREEAMEDLAVFLSEQSKIQDSIETFKNLTGDDEYFPQALLRLGKRYERNADYKKALEIYKKIALVAEEGEPKFLAQCKIVELSFRTNQYAYALKELRKMNLSSAKSEEAVIEKTNLKARVRALATFHQEQFRKKGYRPSLRVAEEYYKTYLEIFLNQGSVSPESEEIKVYLAEVKRDLNRPMDAADLYEEVFNSKDRKYAESSAALWLVSLSEVIKNEKLTSSQMKQMEQKYIDASKKIASRYPKSKVACEGLLKSAQVVAGDSSQESDAISLSKRVISECSTMPAAITASRLWLQILSDRAKTHAGEQSYYQDLISAIQELENNQSLMQLDRKSGGSKFSQYLEGVKNKAKVSEIAIFEKEEKLDEAAQGYLQFAEQTKDQKLAEKAFENAVRTSMKSKDYNTASLSFERWSRKYPKSKSLNSAMKVSATEFFILNQIEKSARLFEKLGMESNDEVSLFSSIQLYFSNSQTSKARENLKAWMKNFPRSSRKSEGYKMLADSYAISKELKDAKKYYELCSRSGDSLSVACWKRLVQIEPSLRSKAIKDLSKRRDQASKVLASYFLFQIAIESTQKIQFVSLEIEDAQKFRKQLEVEIKKIAGITKTLEPVIAKSDLWSISGVVEVTKRTLEFQRNFMVLQKKWSTKKDESQILASIIQTLDKNLKNILGRGLGTLKKLDTLSYDAPEMYDLYSEVFKKNEFRVQGKKPSDFFKYTKLPEESIEQVRNKLLKNIKNWDAWLDLGVYAYHDNQVELSKLYFEQAKNYKKTSSSANEFLAWVQIQNSNEKLDWFEMIQAYEMIDSQKNQATLDLKAYYRKEFSYPLSLWSAGKWKEAEEKISDLKSSYLEEYFSAVSEIESKNPDYEDCFDEAKSASLIAKNGFEFESAERLMLDCKFHKEMEE